MSINIQKKNQTKQRNINDNTHTHTIKTQDAVSLFPSSAYQNECF